MRRNEMIQLANNMIDPPLLFEKSENITERTVDCYYLFQEIRKPSEAAVLLPYAQGSGISLNPIFPGWLPRNVEKGHPIQYHHDKRNVPFYVSSLQ
jgi:hypothetical protein